jgi:YD repeat-containing protein
MVVSLVSVLVVLAMSGPASASAAEPTGSIVGTVTNAATKAPVEGIEVCPYPTEGEFVEELFVEELFANCARANAGGEYNLSSLPIGQYKVSFGTPRESALNYIPQYYNAKPSYAEAELVLVTSGGTKAGIDAALSVGGQITGTVTDASTKAAINGIEVCAFRSGGEFRGCTKTNASGKYTVSGLSTGSYTVEFEPPFESTLNYLRQYYKDKSTSAEAEAVAVSTGSATPGIDAALNKGGRITGTVTDASSKAAIQGIGVCAAGRESVSYFQCTQTNASGEYAVSGAPTGQYTVEFASPRESHLNYETQYYNDKESRAEAEPVSVTVGIATGGIDAAMQKGGQITGTVTNASTKAALNGITVCVYEISVEFARCTTTNAGGEYTVSALSTGQYRVDFSSRSGGYATQYYNGKASYSEAQPVAVTTGVTIESIDAALQPAGKVTGTVTSASTKAALSWIEVCARQGKGESITSCTITNAEGRYTLSRMPVGEYTIQFTSSSEAPLNYVTQYYNDKSSLAEAELLLVTAGGTTPAIDAAMQVGDETWSGEGAREHEQWSNTVNWVSHTAPPASSSIGTLEFPKLTSSACTTEPITDACYSSNNDISGLKVNELVLDGPYGISGERITLEGGREVSLLAAPTGILLTLPIELGASQNWLIEGPPGAEENVSGVFLAGGLTGESHALSVYTSNSAGILLASKAEVGPVAFNGVNQTDTGAQAKLNGGVDIGPGSSLNSSDGNPTTITDAELAGEGEVGPLKSIGSEVRAGCGPAVEFCLSEAAGVLQAASVELDSQSNLAFSIITAGTLAATDYSQLTSHGNVSLGEATLAVDLAPRGIEGKCSLTLTPGARYTLISTTGTLSGTFSNAASQLTEIPLTEPALCPPSTQGLLIEYHREPPGSETPSTVSATVIGGVPVNTTLPAISGTVKQGQTLTEIPGSWTNSPSAHSYQWLRCHPTGSECLGIAGAAFQSYQLSSADVGSSIRVAETASNLVGAGTPALSAASATVPRPPIPENTSIPTVVVFDGGNAYFAEAGSWTNEPTGYSYQWERCDAAGVSCANIAGAQSYVYFLVEADVGKTLRVEVDAQNAGGSGTGVVSAQSSVIQAAPANTASPTISGTATQGDTLTEAHGKWTGSPTSFAYQWERCDTSGGACQAIPGAVEQTYTLSNLDVGATVRVQETANNATRESAPAVSAASAGVQAAPGVPTNISIPTISGSAHEGQTLTEAHGTWTGSPTSYSYQWQRCDMSGSNCSAISGATEQTYVVSVADGESTIRVEETATNSSGASVPMHSNVTSTVPGVPTNTAPPSISGSAHSGQPLTEAHGTWTGSPTSYSYQWLRCDATGANCIVISGAIEQTYQLAAGDVGATIEVQETATNSIGASSPAASRVTFVVTVTPPPPVNTKPPSILGTVEQGQTLTEEHGSWTAEPASFSYQWLRCDAGGGACAPISGATGETYIAVDEDVGHALRVEETASNAAGSSSPAESAPTAVVKAAPGQITGTVTGTASKAAVDGISVCAGEPGQFGELLTQCASTNASGEYKIGNLARGHYDVAFSAPEGSGLNYLTQYYDDKPALSEAHAVVVEAGETKSGIDASMQTGGQVTGTVTAAATKTPLAGIEVCALGGSCATTNASGTYVLTSLATGLYLVEFHGGSSYLSQNYNELVAVTAGLTTSEVNVAMQILGEITGHVTSVATNAAIAGVVVCANWEVEFTRLGKCASTNAAGDYAIAELQPRSYEVDFVAPEGVNYAEQRYKEPVSAEAAKVTAEINTALDVGGRIAGNVTSAATKAPVQGIEVCASPGTELNQPEAECAHTDGAGNYTVSRLAAGLHKVTFAAGTSKADYLTQYYNGKVLESEGEDVIVEPGVTKSEIDAIMQIGGEITGTVTSAATTTPIEGIEACAYDAKQGVIAACAFTGAGGEYSVTVPTGSYKVGFLANGHNYLTQYYNGRPSLSEAQAVTVTNEVATPGINAALSAAGQITGTVTSAATNAPLEGIVVCTSELDCAQTNPSGEYTISGLASGKYKVDFQGGAYFTQYYNEKSSPAEAEDVSVVAAIATPSIDAAMRALPSAPENTAPPTIAGTPQENQSVTEVHGSWANEPANFTYQWLQCDSFGFACLPISGATSQTYEPVPADVGDTLRVQETASNAGGSGSPVESAATAVVKAAPPVNIAAPRMKGTAQQEQTITEEHGLWTNEPTSFAVQWVRCDAEGANCGRIAEATAQSYVPGSADVGHTLKVEETASNETGPSSPATSKATAVVVPPAPVSIKSPEISGTAQNGQTLVESPGSWKNGPTAFAYQWLRCNEAGVNCKKIEGAVNQTYRVTPADIGLMLDVQEVASGIGGLSSPAKAKSTAVVTAVPLHAVAGEDLNATAGVAVTFDGSGSTPPGEIEHYRWRFGDGESGEGKSTAHVYSAPGTYKATLAISRGTEENSQALSVSVGPPPSHFASITTIDSGAHPVAGTDVLYVGSDGKRTEAVTDGKGTAILPGLPDGSDTVYAYKSGYRPTVGHVTVKAGDGSASISMVTGEVATSTLKSHELSLAEIEAASIDPSAPGNSFVSEFEVRLAFPGSPGTEPPVQFHCYINILGFFVGLCEFAGGGGGGFLGECNPNECRYGDVVAVPSMIGGHPLIQWLILRGQTAVLKQFFAVSMVVQNLSPEPFKLTKGSATLAVPPGMSLAPTTSPQAETQGVLNIPGMGSSQTTWIVRGDEPGKYFLSASYHGTLEPVNKPVDLEARLAEPLVVWGANALSLSVKADRGSLQEGVPYHVSIGVTNEAPVPLYNVAVSIDLGTHANFIFQPQQEPTEILGEIPPGHTEFTRQYIVVPDAPSAGDLEPSLSSVHFVGETIRPGNGIEPVEPPPLYSMSANAVGSTAQLRWEAVPGAEGYELFATPSLLTPFEAEPLAVFPAAKTEATVVGTAAASEYYAVSTIINGELVLDHPVLTPAEPEPLTAGERMGGGNPSDPSSCQGALNNVTSNPCDAASGNFWHTFNDMSVPGRGPALGLTRTYNSLAAAVSGPFGNGWSSSYTMGLAFPDANHVVVNQENGSQVTFVEQADKTYAAPPHVAATLVHDGDGSWTFVRRRRDTFSFDATGRLTRETDLNGYVTSLAYNGSGQFTTVTDPAGRTLTFAYSGSHIISVTGPLGRVVTYTYDGAGDLTDVTDVNGGNTHFMYDSSHRMLTMRMPNQAPGVPGSTGAAITNTYDSQGRVVSQSDQLKRTTTFSYTGNAFTPQGGTTTVTDPKGNVTLRVYKAGEVVAKTAGYGTPQAATWTFAYDPNPDRAVTTAPPG